MSFDRVGIAACSGTRSVVAALVAPGGNRSLGSGIRPGAPVLGGSIGSAVIAGDGGDTPGGSIGSTDGCCGFGAGMGREDGCCGRSFSRWGGQASPVRAGGQSVVVGVALPTGICGGGGGALGGAKPGGYIDAESIPGGIIGADGGGGGGGA